MSNPDSNNQEAGEQTERASPETLALAREMGWKDPADWQGDPPRNGFVTAQEFVRRSEKVLPIVNARAKNAEERAAKLEARLEEQARDHRDTIKRIERMSTVALEQQRSQIEARYASVKEAAVEVGDKVAYKQAVADEKEATKALDAKLEPTDEEKKERAIEQGKLPKATQDTIDAWMSENPWYKPNTDDEMSIVATRRHLKLQEEKKGLSLSENLAEVTKYIRKRYPEEFSADDDKGDDDEPAPRRGSRVEGSSRNGGGGGSAKSFAKLPAEAKAICDNFIKEDGLFLEAGETAAKNLGAARERYAAQYFGDET